MARLSISEIMTRIALTVNQEATAPTAASAEYNLWLGFINRALDEWSEANDWEAMRKRFFPITTGTSGASVALPLDFRKLGSEVKVFNTGNSESPQVFPEVLPEQDGLYGSNDAYVTIYGNTGDGFSLQFHPATIASGASIMIQYYATATSLVTSNQYLPLSDPQFAIDRSVAYILEARSDARFQQSETKARDALLQMIENNNLAKFNSYAGSNNVITPERKQGFRVGRD